MKMGQYTEEQIGRADLLCFLKENGGVGSRSPRIKML